MSNDYILCNHLQCQGAGMCFNSISPSLCGPDDDSKSGNGPEAKHLDDGKVGLQYVLSMPALEVVCKVGDFGAQKYGQWNYRKGMPWMKLLGSCSRHLVAFILGHDNDVESGLSHLAHLAYNALMLLGYVMENKGTDDRYKGA